MKCIAWLVLGVCIGVLASAVYGAEAPKPIGPLPSASQLRWQEGELTMFVHFTVNTFTGREWGDGKEAEKIFNPTQLDARQWAKAAKEAGFTMMILTAKHHDGFCLWPTKLTDHCVRSSPWKEGKGDVVKEFVDAVRGQGMKVGLYLSPWDRNQPVYGDSPKYDEYYKGQLRELLTQYGPIAEMWFDGANGEGPNGKKQVYDWEGYRAVIRELMPEVVQFSDAGPDIRWIGNEHGFAGDPCWSMVDPKRVPYAGFNGKGVHEALQHGDETGTVWRPGECDVSIRPGWFWHAAEDAKLKTVDQLVEIYFKSVGRNSLMLLNVPPNDKGLLADGDVKRLKEFRAALDEIFKTNLAAGATASASNTRGGDAAYGPGNAVDGKAQTYWATDDAVTKECWIELDLGKPVKFNIACLKENIALGQRVSAWRLEVPDGDKWKTIQRGTTIGRKKLDRFEPVTAQKVRLVIESARACPVISGIELYSH